MKMRESVLWFGRNINPTFDENEYCSFAPPEETLGVIDTSPHHNGRHGIAFMTDKIRLNPDGISIQLDYSCINSVEIIESYEGAFYDELVIHTMLGSLKEVRISDCSLHKHFLKQLIDTLRRLYSTSSESEREEELAHCTRRALEHFGLATSDTDTAMPEEHAPVDVQQSQPVQAETPASLVGTLVERYNQNHTDVPQPAEPAPEPVQPDTAPIQPDATDDDISGEDIDLADMSREQTMDYLSSTICEINTAVTDEPKPAKPPVQPKSSYTIEPPSDDIYIQASRKIREICEGGSLDMTRIENALKDKLTVIAAAYADITVHGGYGVPPKIAVKISKLKAATDRLPQYFGLGEDIATRVMFFMMFQMLSYSDRIAQKPETKERLNDFFRHYGPAGITLSMLDSAL